MLANNSSLLSHARASLGLGVVIIGAGQAGGRTAEALRSNGYTGSITIIGDEPFNPYERPSLSKDMLLKPEDQSITWVQTPQFYEQNNIQLHTGVSAISINRTQRCVELSNNQSISYGVLILATGAAVRQLSLPGISEHNCFYLRTLEDSRQLSSRLRAGGRVVVLGAGFIGLEAAAAASQLGCDVTVVELGPHPLGRVVPKQVGHYYKNLHEAHGVKFVFSKSIIKISKSEDYSILEADDGTTIPAQILIAGIGVTPNTSLASTAGLSVERGIMVDEFLQTNDPCIFAIGDAARHYSPRYGRHILLESWQSAQNQAINIAQNLTSQAEAQPYAALPWFWSDQYKTNFQMFGLPRDNSETIIRGDEHSSSWMLFQLVDKKLVCAIGINAARDLRPARDLINLAADLQPDELADTSRPMVEILRSKKQALAQPA